MQQSCRTPSRDRSVPLRRWFGYPSPSGRTQTAVRAQRSWKEHRKTQY
jgi:hypothetical protein